VPRPRHAEGDFAAQERFKAAFRRRKEELTRAVQVWARRGQRPLAVGHQRFHWLHVYGFVRPSHGEVVWHLADAVNAALLSALLAVDPDRIGGATRFHWWPAFI